MHSFPSLDSLDPQDDQFGPQVVDRLLIWACESNATDVHVLPTRHGLAISARIAGVLEPVCEIPRAGERIVARLKVLARLLTYKSDVPQEGRLPLPTNAGTSREFNAGPREARLATCPTVHGERAVLRLFPVVDDLTVIDDLGLPQDAATGWQCALRQSQGLLLVTGPAGSGKTTTAYASLRTILQSSPSLRSIISLEDPVEQLLDGVAQTAVGGTSGLSFAEGLRAILRHDPEILLVGELRDRDTIETAIRAALTGHLVIATLHTGSAVEAIVRLFDANIEPFLILSGLKAVIHQRLVQRTDGQRSPIAEFLSLETPSVRDAVRTHASADELEQSAICDGMTTVTATAKTLVDAGDLSQTEFVRLFGVTSQ